MQYVGSKNRLSKELVPIIQSFISTETVGYIEPFVGGANVIDKITAKTKFGFDNNKELISLLKYAQKNTLPQTITEQEYNEVKNNREDYPRWYVGLVGFCGSFGAKYFGGFARRYNKDGTLFDVPRQAINSLRKQSGKKLFKDIEFNHKDFRDLDINKINNYVVYCDIPYKNTTKYSSGEFPYDEFYEWCRKLSENNIVLISEYQMPSDFRCIWEKQLKTTLGSGVNKNSNKKRIEKIFICK